MIAGEADRLKWSKLEPSEGVYDFTNLYETLSRCRERGYYYYSVIWISPTDLESGGSKPTPDWLFDSVGIPKVELEDSDKVFPYYLDRRFQERGALFYKKLADFIAGLPENMRDRIAFLQPAFGSTGDRQVYKGTPKNSKYFIDCDQYVNYMKNMTKAWVDAFGANKETQVIKFLWNVDDKTDGIPDPNESKEQCGERLYADYMFENHNCQFRKQQFTLAIGYMANGETKYNRLRQYFYGETDRWDGHPEYVRGEISKFADTDMAKASPKWNAYWTAISGVYMGLDAWETKEPQYSSGNYDEAYVFAKKYSFYKKPETSPYAFVALRDVLDYSDTQRFPESVYGNAYQGNEARANNILDEYADYNAKNDDMKSVTKEKLNTYLLKSEGLNDCVYDVNRNNYRRFLYQIDPSATSVGWWRVGSRDQPYGRFARAFESASGKNSMYFDLDDEFYSGNTTNNLKLSVIYFDKHVGSKWELRYDAGLNNQEVAISVTGIGDGRWKTVNATVTDASMSGNGPRGSDLELRNLDSKDDVFHMIEVEKVYTVGQ